MKEETLTHQPFISCVHNFSANIFVFFSAQKLSQIIISNFKILHVFLHSMFQQVEVGLSLVDAWIERFIMQHYSHFNDHYSAVCYDAQQHLQLFFSGLCNQNSMVYNARIVMRLFQFASLEFEYLSSVFTNENIVRWRIILCSLFFVYALKDEAHYLNNRALCRTLKI